MGTVIGVVFVVLILVFIVLWIISKSVNSINKSVQKMQSKDRCIACGRRLKAVDGVYAKKCSKCGADQPSDFARKLSASNMSLQSGEFGKYMGM
jgi:predicted RNA-binding Zn-ribbon protein involved in translation (DUF1610 family)